MKPLKPGDRVVIRDDRSQLNGRCGEVTAVDFGTVRITLDGSASTVMVRTDRGMLRRLVPKRKPK